VLKAIETAYQDYRFRSRLEARWAVLLNALGLIWTYEAEGYDLGAAGYYLPDFFLPAIGCWLEIKGQPPTHGEIQKALALSTQAGQPVVIFYGEIHPRMVGSITTISYHPDGYAWAGCECGWVDIVDLFALNQVQCPACKLLRRFRTDTPTLRSAYIAARSARFEHGEMPR
jgi:hypothetical protein